jgi:DNA-binding NarL/FixJ family response regulator
MRIRLVVADDHPLILHGLTSFLSPEQGFEILARCQDGVETLQAVRHYQPDILLLDLRMPAKDGLSVLRELRQEACPTRVVLLTAELEAQEALEAARLGVQGWC